MKAELRSQGASGAAESKTEDGREKAQESQNELSLLEPFVPFRGNSVSVNPPGHLISAQSNHDKLN
jgi:hypothetical protein